MELLDEHGRVFGIVNIIDLLVVLFVLAVAVAGIALVVGSDESGEPSEQQVTRTVTVELGTHPPDGAALIESGTVTFAGQNHTLTGVYRTPTDDGIRIVAAVRVDGIVEDDVFTTEGAELRYGTVRRLTTPAYTVEATVINIGQTEGIVTTSVTATLTANVSTAVADAVGTGDEYQLAGQTVVTVQDVTRGQTMGDRERLTIEMQFVARDTVAGPMYGGEPIRIGRQLTVATDEYEFVGEVDSVEQ
ncbi:DUF4330 family protein [Halosegnis rubeus]|jgi:hypothetical protein|uniref:DUF4330 family protein n=1 Tax=Halosegnis rubeus TaxID=2212850 RepID=A0A5N5U9W2_9EURY|nr:DUF4330 family protein [Halosegnis rubeus]KAB7514641.1 DUF4330 family protein [Halosegnis rubeus]KAB7517940.1 DUF4330 family protein [Halosegnis rubeus]